MMNKGLEKKWYVLKVISGQENKVKKNIHSEITRMKLEDHIAEVLIPIEKIFQVKDGKRVVKEKINYPGYIMIHGVLEGEIASILKSIVNVVGFLGERKGGQPVPLREAEVNRMLGKKEENALLNTEVIAHNVGDLVKVIHGPFNGFDGTIEKVNEKKMKLEVMVKIFGRNTPLELNYTQVEKVLCSEYCYAKRV